jgi:hypothetical protein
MNNQTKSESTTGPEQLSRISNMQFSTINHSKYVKLEQMKKAIAKNKFKHLVKEIIDKKKWKDRFTKIKVFIHTNQKALSQQLGAGKDLEEYMKNEKNQIFNLILALYAEEDETEVYRDLDLMCSKYPSEFEFYIPQLCTYLFHFESGTGEEEEKV